MSKVIFIITAYPGLGDESHRVIWEAAKDCSPKLLDRQDCVAIKIDDDRILAIENEPVDTNEAKARILNSCFEHLQAQEICIQQVYYATHCEYAHIEEHLNNRIRSPHNCLLKHTEESEAFETIKSLLGLRKNNNPAASRKFDELCEIIRKKAVILNFSLLKHRIAHLFLPLDIDLQGIEEVKNQEVRNQERDRISVKYLTEVLEEKRDGPEVNGSACYYRQKLADLWWMVGKFKVQSSEFKNDNPCIKERQYSVPPSSELETQITESILELVGKDADERAPEKWDEIEKLKALLLELSGLERNTSSLLKPQLSSPIFQFMCLLDCGIKEQRYDNVDQILRYFSAGQDISGASPNPLKSFHDWFCAVHDCLDKLRNRVYHNRE
jgi:hypothetical protein